MKNYSIVCKVTGTQFDGNLTLLELRNTLVNYFNEDFGCDFDEVIKFCEFQEISVLQYFIEGLKFDNDLMNIFDRYEILDNSGEIVDVERLLPDLFNKYFYHWFYNNNCPKFVITDSNNQPHVINFWNSLKNFFNWDIVIEKELMHDLLKYGEYQYIDMIAGDNFKIEIVGN